MIGRNRDLFQAKNLPYTVPPLRCTPYQNYEISSTILIASSTQAVGHPSDCEHCDTAKETAYPSRVSPPLLLREALVDGQFASAEAVNLHFVDACTTAGSAASNGANAPCLPPTPSFVTGRPVLVPGRQPRDTGAHVADLHCPTGPRKTGGTQLASCTAQAGWLIG